MSTMGETSVAVPQPVRWSRWLVAGIVCGLVVGFAVGLAKPHTRR